ncbi:hypothetical protein ACVU7I_10115 [Patulibacter sp. S7RM1-6]
MTLTAHPSRALRRLLLVLAAVAAVLVAAAPASAAKTTWGIADQKSEIFGMPEFGELHEAGLSTARLVVRFDALKYKHNRKYKHYAATIDAWLRGAKAADIRPVVSFWITVTNSKSLRKKLTEKRYMQEFRRFRKAYPWVRDFSIFNEPNLTGPFKRNPRDLGRIYKAVRHELRNCKSCRVLGGDLHLESASATADYAAEVRRGAGRSIGLWGVNNYNDVNDRTYRTTAAFLRSSAIRRSKVWIMESGGVYARKSTSERRNPFLAQRKKAKSDSAREKYQYEATRFYKRLVTKYRRQIQRAYIYQLQSEPNEDWKRGSRNGSWDSGLLDPRGEPRRAFDYVVKHIL